MRRSMSATRLLVLVGVIAAVAACNETTAPMPTPGVTANDGPCLTGYTSSDGRCLPDSTGGH